MPEKIGLFSWFHSTMERAFADTLPLFPAEILRHLKAPEKLCLWAETIEDADFTVKFCGEEVLPDIESRGRKIKKTSGQFYTPETFAREILEKIQPDLTGDILDPSCGDGSFLLAAANALNASGGCDENLLTPLHGYDIDNQALLICLARLKSAFPMGGWPSLQHDDFLLSKIYKRFDLIIGNPPYKVNLSESLKEILRKTYSTSEGEKDLYTFFIERSIKLLTNDGCLIMLTSHTYLVNHHCKLIRQFVFSQKVEDLFLLPTRFFPGAPGVLPVVLNLRATRLLPGEKVRVHSGYSAGLGWEKQFMADSGSLLSESGLRQAIVPKSLKDVFAKMSEKFQQLGKLCRVGVGIQESVKRTDKISKFVSETKETPNHRKVLKGRELSPFKIEWTGKFINYGPHLAYAGDENLFSGKKLLYQNIRNEKLKFRLVAAYDDCGYFPKNSLSFILAQDKRLSAPYLEAILNSLLVNAWFSGHFHSFHITVSQVRTIPVPIPEERLRRKIERSVSRLKGFDKESEEWKNETAKLNLLVCECYLGSCNNQHLLSACDIFLEQAATL